MTRPRWIASGAAVSLLAVEIVGAHPHSLLWWHGVPAFDLVYGLAGCVAIVLGSKFLGSVWLQRPEDPTERDES